MGVPKIAMVRAFVAFVACSVCFACGDADIAAPPEPAAADSCNLHTDYPGDEYCLPPPPADKGFQVHIGPSDYANPEPQYVLQPSSEVATYFSAVSSNTEPIYFYYRQYRMRPGTHHNIIGTVPVSDLDLGRRLAITNHLSEDNPKNGVPAPENEGVGIQLDPHTPLLVDMHSINTTDRPILREAWVNFWYRPAAEVSDPVQEMAQAGDETFAIPPHADTMLGPFRCTVFGEGRMLWMYGHRHANNVRFSAWRIRGEERTPIYEAYDWADPLLLEYSSNVENPTSDRDQGVEGGYSGVLDLKPGDALEWECHVINQTDGTLRFTNENFKGEMCILDAELVGANCF